jgi:outer membrane protein assembly factor BamE
MIKKLSSIIILVAMLSLASCDLVRVYRPNIQQGNVITPAQLTLIHRGMSRQQVINKLGYPVLTNVPNTNQLVYLYSYQPAYGQLTRQYLIISFKGKKVTKIETNMNLPSYSPSTDQIIKDEGKVVLPKPVK